MVKIKEGGGKYITAVTQNGVEVSPGYYSLIVPLCAKNNEGEKLYVVPGVDSLDGIEVEEPNTTIYGLYYDLFDQIYDHYSSTLNFSIVEATTGKIIEASLVSGNNNKQNKHNQ